MQDHSTIKRYLSSVSAKALNYSCRLMLANNLDSKHTLQSEKGFIRDYRGLADLMGFQYHKIKEFEEVDDITMKILEEWEKRPDATLDKLITYLEDMDHHAILEELVPLLRRSVDAYLEYQTSRSDTEAVAEKCVMYDAYVSYADEDSHIADELVQNLESPKVGLKLFFRGRDVLDKIYWCEADTNIDLVKKRCRHLLVLLTVNFIKSSAVEFLDLFDGSLENSQKHRVLIPLILEPCEMPAALLNLSKIDLTKDYIYDCMWNRLVTALQPAGSTSNNSAFGIASLRNRETASKTPGSIAFENTPSTISTQSSKRKLSNISNPGAPPSPYDASNITKRDSKESRSRKSSNAEESEKEDSLTSPSNIFNQFKSLLKKKAPSRSISSSPFASSTTTLFHSDPASIIKTFDNLSDNFLQNTSH